MAHNNITIKLDDDQVADIIRQTRQMIDDEIKKQGFDDNVIAAAPKMLVALEGLIEEVNKQSMVHPDLTNKIWQAEKIITKARGEL